DVAALLLAARGLGPARHERLARLRPSASRGRGLGHGARAVRPGTALPRPRVLGVEPERIVVELDRDVVLLARERGVRLVDEARDLRRRLLRGGRLLLGRLLLGLALRLLLRVADAREHVPR